MRKMAAKNSSESLSTDHGSTWRTVRRTRRPRTGVPRNERRRRPGPTPAAGTAVGVVG